MTDETVDLLEPYDLQVTQPRHGYRFSLDPLLLCDFADPAGKGRIADLGTGCGVIPLVLARMAPAATITGFEHQRDMADLAVRNALTNGLSDRITILHEDVLHVRRHFPVSSFDLVVANPPYRKPGTGKISPKAGRDMARHESTAGLADFLAAAKYLVRPGGSICVIHHPIRMAELFSEAVVQKLALLRLRMVHGNETAEAGMFLVELAKGRKGDLRVLPPFFVHDAEGRYTEEMKRVLGQKGGEERVTSTATNAPT